MVARGQEVLIIYIEGSDHVCYLKVKPYKAWGLWQDNWVVPWNCLTLLLFVIKSIWIHKLRYLRNIWFNISTQPRHCMGGFRTSLWMSLSGQPEPGLEPDWTSLERPENSCAATLPIQPDRALRGRMGVTPQVQVCQACSVIPKKSRGCNRCQRSFNKVLSKCDTSGFFFYMFAKCSFIFCFVIMGYCV
jgi:hypothetical protein